jgi:hypothetical protein
MAWWQIFKQDGLLRRGLGLTHDSDQTKKAQVALERERGTSGTERLGGDVINFTDYNPAMQGEQFFNNVDMMRKADGSVKCASLLIKLPLLRTTCQIVAQSEDEQDAQNLLIAETAHEKILGPMAMTETWQQTLRHLLLMFDFGFSTFEKVWEVDEDGLLHYRRLAVRLPKTIEGFKVNSEGIPTYIIQNAVRPGGTKTTLRIPCPTYGAIFSWEREGDNYFGQSIYRAMYKHWWYKEALYHIDALRLDRWGVGVPKAMVKSGYGVKPSEESMTKRILANLRSNTQSWLYHPEEIEFGILAPAGQGGALGLMDSVNHHDTMIFRAVLTQFISAGNQAFGNYGSVKNYSDLFLYAEQAAANFIEEEFSRQIIRPFCDFNFNMELPNGKMRPYPRLRFADVQKINVKELAEALARLTSGKLITPDDDLESFIRKLGGFPKLPERFSRVTNKLYPDEMLKAKAQVQAKPGESGRITSPGSEGNRNVNQPKVE